MRSFRSPSLLCPTLPSAIINRLFELIEASDEEHARPLTMFALRWPACLPLRQPGWPGLSSSIKRK